jgi:hypothetical protein
MLAENIECLLQNSHNTQGQVHIDPDVEQSRQKNLSGHRHLD